MRTNNDCVGKIKVGWSETAGRGIFTKKDIKKGEVVLGTAVLQEWNRFIYTNHKCGKGANTKLQEGRNQYSDKLVARRNIVKGEEITFDYRKTRWRDFFEMIKDEGGCVCASCSKKTKTVR